MRILNQRKNLLKIVIVLLLSAVLLLGYCNGLFSELKNIKPSKSNNTVVNNMTDNYYYGNSQAEIMASPISAEVPIGDMSKVLSTKPYALHDNVGYDRILDDMYSEIFGKEDYPFDNNFAEISLEVDGGYINKGNSKNNTDAYGIVMGGEIGEGNLTPIEIRLKYNYNTTTNINGTAWQVSEDTWKTAINGIEGVGVVGTGALLVQKSYTGNPNDYKWENPYSQGITTSYHTVDFTTHYRPQDYYNEQLAIYTPSGEDLNRGVFIKVSFAYELKKSTQEWTLFGTKTVWHYINVLEETTFYVCHSNTEILFQNLVFTDSAESQDSTSTELIRMAGTIMDGHATNEGFRINTNGSESTIEYKKNGSSGYTETQNGAVFTEPGRYDFRITPVYGQTKYTTIYINESGTQQNVEYYFGKGIITENSHRIFDEEPIPVYLAGETEYKINAPSDKNHMPLVGEIRRMTGQELVKLEEGDDGYDPDKKGEDQYIVQPKFETVAILSMGNNNSTWKGKLTEPGYYIAEFANNPNYFDGVMSGDCYHFVFQFMLVDKANDPIINQNLFENNLSFSSYAAGYWGVTLPSNGIGNVTFAFTSYAESYSFAYQYYRSLVTEQGGNYTFQDASYPSQFEVLDKVMQVASSKIQRKYFDATNPNSYLTIQNAGTEILSQNLKYDIVVMSDLYGPYNAVLGEPFLNDRLYNYIDENGNPQQGKTPVRFISVAGFESSSVQLIHEQSKFSINIDYGAPVESVLNGKNAPSGRYKIIETNIYGNENIYYAIYIRPGDLQTTLNVEWAQDKFMSSTILGVQNSSMRFNRANSFIIRSAANTLDPYGIVKIEKLGADGYIDIYQLDEVKDLKIEEEGNYVIHVVDRLGNTVKYYVDIYIAQKIYTFTLNNNGEEFFKGFASGGQTFNLSIPENSNTKLEFIGWQDNQGNIYNDTYIFNAAKDVVLEAVWHYKNTTVEIFDGNKINTYTVKPGDKIVLPDVSKTGLSLYGFAYTQGDGTMRFYRGQITSVPNVSNMRLDVMWVDYNQTFTETQPERDGMIFVGWLNQTSGLGGVILDAEDVESDMTVYSLWLSDSDVQSQQNGFLGIFKNISTSAGIGISTSIGIVIILLLMSYLIVKIRKTNLAPQAVVAMQAGSAVAVFKPNYGFDAQEEIREEIQRARLRKREKALSSRRGFYRMFVIPAIAFALCLIFIFSGSAQLITGLKSNHDRNAAITALKRDYEAQKAQFDVQDQRKTPENQYLSTVTQAFSDTSAEQNNSEISDEEAFLYSLVFIDLLSFGYDVFPAVAIKNDGTTIRGLGYSMYDEAYEKDGDDKIYFGAGFVALFGESEITDTDVLNGVEINPILVDEGEEPIDYGFILSFEDTYGPIHYIAYNEYVKYGIENFKIHRIAKENNPSNYDLNLGYLYDYDLGRPIYDPDLGKEFKLDGFSIVQGVDYDYAYQISKNTINQQDQNYLTVDTLQVLYISIDAINAYIANNQEESYLGIPADALQSIESQLDSTLFYYIDRDGEVQVLQIPPDPERNVFRIILSAAQIALGGLLIITGVGAGIGAMMVIGGTIGLISEFFCEELGVVFGGLGTIGNGLNCLLVGIQLFSCGPVGWVAGTVLVATGAATMAFGANDILTVATGRNFIREITGMSEQAYYWWNLGLNIASTVFAIAGSIGQAKGVFCFVAGTGVLAIGANGVVVKTTIEDIKVGDRVLSYNEATGMTEIKTVTQVFKSTHSEVVNIGQSNGQVVTSSLGHPYYTQRGWISAENLRAGDILQAVNGETVIVEFVQHELLESSQTLYNFEVDGNHNYYVAESVDNNVSDFVLVHNKGCGKTSPNQMNEQIRQGKAPNGVKRVDVGKVAGEQVHAHLNNGSAINIDGTIKHGTGEMTNGIAEWLKSFGWKL